jgi:hypothetical protein
MSFIPKQHLEIGNYIKYIDEILHKCDKGVEYCKICPNEFVCSELEKDDFGLNGATISDVLTAIQYALNKVPGYLNPGKRNELRDHIKSYINESPLHERKVWENSVLDILLDDKLANPGYKPKSKIGEIRTLLTYNSKISFSTTLKCLCLENATTLGDARASLSGEIFLNSIMVVNQFVQSRHPDTIILPPTTRIKHRLEEGMADLVPGCKLYDIGLPAALCYYAMLTKQPIPTNSIVTGGLDSHGRALQVEFLDGKIETVLRELHFIDKIIIPKGASWSIPIPDNTKIIEVNTFEQTIQMVFRNDMAI